MRTKIKDLENVISEGEDCINYFKERSEIICVV